MSTILVVINVVLKEHLKTDANSEHFIVAQMWPTVGTSTYSNEVRKFYILLHATDNTLSMVICVLLHGVTCAIKTSIAVTHERQRMN